MYPKFRRFFLLILLLIAQNVVHSDEASEAAVKAGFIFNFFKFIEWSGEAANREQFLLCTQGDGLVSQGLQLLDGKTVNGKVLNVQQHVQGEALRACHIVYLENATPAILKDLRAYPVVTVGSSDNFIQQGGVVGLLSVNEHLGFEINVDVAQANGLRISAPMLKLAKSVLSSK